MSIKWDRCNKIFEKIEFPDDFREIFTNIIENSTSELVSQKLTTVFTDFYLLSRMFAEFETTQEKIDRSPIGCPITGDFKTPKYIIVYGGDAHIQSISDFLHNMFIGRSDSNINYTTDNIMHRDKKIIINKLYRGTNPKLKDINDLINTFLN